MTNYILAIETATFYFSVGALFWTGWRLKHFRGFPLLYSYLIYMTISSLVMWPIYWWSPSSYPRAAWARLLTIGVAEFVVLLEVADHLFIRFPVVRRLGRLVTFLICAALLLVYVLPAIQSTTTSHHLILEFFKRASLTKAVLVVGLLAACRIYRLSVERQVAGILLGFSLFLVSTVVNVGLLEHFHDATFGLAYGLIGPISYTLGILIWAVALWSPSPAAETAAAAVGRSGEEAGMQLEKLNSTLARLLRR